MLQVTVGCSHNGCTYCAMYDLPEQKFRVKPWEVVQADIVEAARFDTPATPLRRVFLCDGDALILPTEHLARILTEIRLRLPGVRRVGIYGDARSILRKSAADLARLKGLGLGIVYHGAESGDDEVLARVNKGSTAAEAAAAARRLKEAGLRHSVMVMLGLGGVEGSQRHAERTAALLTEMDPPHVGALTTTLVPDTPLYREHRDGTFRLPDAWGMLRELRVLIAESRFSRCRFSANHASNYLPLSLNLPADRDRALALLDRTLAERRAAALKPESLRGL